MSFQMVLSTEYPIFWDEKKKKKQAPYIQALYISNAEIKSS